MRLVEEEMHERRGCVGGGLGGWNLWYVDGVTLIATLREEWRKLACAVKRHSETVGLKTKEVKTNVMAVNGIGPVATDETGIELVRKFKYVGSIKHYK